MLHFLQWTILRILWVKGVFFFIFKHLWARKDPGKFHEGPWTSWKSPGFFSRKRVGTLTRGLAVFIRVCCICMLLCVCVCICVICVFFVFFGFFLYSFLLQYFDTVGWVFWPVKTVSRITCIFFGGDVKHCTILCSPTNISISSTLKWGCLFVIPLTTATTERDVWTRY